MAHLSKAYVRFFKDLAANSNREWFKANKKRYENDVKDPFYALVADVIERAQQIDPGINLEVKHAVFRIYRDVRFSKDKTPYKMHMSAVVSRGGRKDMQDPGVYFQVEASRVMIAGGCYKPDRDNLAAIRQHIVDNAKAAEKLQKDKAFLKYFPGGIGGEKNKILPKEFKEHAEDLPVLFNKQYFFHNEYKGQKYVTDKDLAAFIIKHYKAGRKWEEFLREAIGK